jgi:predicted RNase H-like nuclease (RuvC/YqgF family)
VPFRTLPGTAVRGSMSLMSETVQKLSKRIEELQGAARKARLEAMQLAARLLTTSNSELAGAPTNAHREGELTALRVRYEGLVKIAEEAQTQIDRLQAEEHERKYYR